jgi:hypothetical protein
MHCYLAHKYVDNTQCIYIGSWVTNIGNPINFQNALTMVIVA